MEVAPHCGRETAISIALFLPGLLEKYGINSPLRVAHFLAQTAHESGDFRVFNENLNYSATELLRIFPLHFRTMAVAKECSRKPEKIANRIYSNRNGNGSAESGDGWKFRGRGMIQLSGRDNYLGYSVHSGLHALDNPDLLLSIEGAAESAAWFWLVRTINKAADDDDVLKVTKLVNGGKLGLAERTAKLAIAKQVVKRIFS